jgi:hypothetical protein
LIVLSGGVGTCSHMHRVAHSQLYRQLTDAGFSVNIYRDSCADSYDPKDSRMTIMHVRAVCGIEKKVVVFVPCLQHQVKHCDPASPPKPTYAQVVQKHLKSMENHPRDGFFISGSSVEQCGNTVLQSEVVSRLLFSVESYDHEFPPLSRQCAFPSVEPYVWETLAKCSSLNLSQKIHLATLGLLNLHWLWYAASRALSTVIIFHY